MKPGDDYLRDEKLFAQDLKTMEAKAVFYSRGIDVSELDLHQITKLAAERMTEMHIKKTGEDSCHFALNDGERTIDEDVDGAQLRGLLSRETLIDASIDEVLHRFDTQAIGYEITVACLGRITT